MLEVFRDKTVEKAEDILRTMIEMSDDKEQTKAYFDESDSHYELWVGNYKVVEIYLSLGEEVDYEQQLRDLLVEEQ